LSWTDPDRVVRDEWVTVDGRAVARAEIRDYSGARVVVGGRDHRQVPPAHRWVGQVQVAVRRPADGAGGRGERDSASGAGTGGDDQERSGAGRRTPGGWIHDRGSDHKHLAVGEFTPPGRAQRIEHPPVDVDGLVAAGMDQATKVVEQRPSRLQVGCRDSGVGPDAGRGPDDGHGDVHARTVERASDRPLRLSTG
jgi:hypothetical protein